MWTWSGSPPLPPHIATPTVTIATTHRNHHHHGFLHLCKRTGKRKGKSSGSKSKASKSKNSQKDKAKAKAGKAEGAAASQGGLQATTKRNEQETSSRSSILTSSWPAGSCVLTSSWRHVSSPFLFFLLGPFFLILPSFSSFWRLSS